MKRDFFNRYTDEILNLFRLNRNDLFVKNKKRDVVDARNLLYYMCTTRQMRVVTIQEYMAEEGYVISHSSILYGIGNVQEKIINDKDYLHSINRIELCII